MAKKTVCPISRSAFLTKAKKITIQIGEHRFDADPKEFSTGSLGWYLNGKISIDIDGINVPVQIGMNLTVVGSKELPPSETPAAHPPKAEADAEAE